MTNQKPVPSTQLTINPKSTMNNTNPINQEVVKVKARLEALEARLEVVVDKLEEIDEGRYELGREIDYLKGEDLELFGRQERVERADTDITKEEKDEKLEEIGEKRDALKEQIEELQDKEYSLGDEEMDFEDEQKAIEIAIKIEKQCLA